MAFDINTFKSQMKYGGARTDLFQVVITNPTISGVDNVLPFRCRATQLPDNDINVMSLWYFGRPVRVAGNHQYGQWNVEIFDDEDWVVRNSLETWCNMINGPESNIRKLSGSDMSFYKSTAQVTHFSQVGQPLRVYQMEGIFPARVANIPLDWQQDNIAHFGVTFALDYSFVVSTQTGNAGGT